MEGLKLIAQSTFDRHQKFRPAGEGQSPYRYNVVEIGAFGAPAPQFSSLVSPTSATATSGSRTVSKRQSVGSLQQQQQKSPSGSGAGATHLQQDGAASTARTGAASSTATTKRVTLNEWMVHEDDLVAFMKKRPVELVATNSSSTTTTTEDKASKTQQSVTTTNSTGAHSKAFTSPSGSKPTENTSNDNRSATSTKRDRGLKPDEIEAVASLKLICIPRAEPPAADLSNSAASGISGDFPSEATGGATALAISREAFLRLYVDQMDADHCALYYLARDYDGFHEFNDHSRGIVTKFVGTSDYALIWTFNRRTLETKGLFIDRYHRWQPTTESSSLPTTNNYYNNNNNATRAPTSGFGSAPVTPSNKSIRQESSSVTTTPSKRWTKRQTGTVSSSVAWAGFRDTLKMYRKYIYAPQLPSFVCCVHMLRNFDDEVNDEDLPALRNIEANLGAFQQQQQQQQQYHYRDGSQGSDAGNDVMHNRLGSFMRAPSSSFAFVSQQQPDPFANGQSPQPPPPITPPPPPQQQQEDHYPNNNDVDRKNSLPNLMPPGRLSLPVPPPLLDTEKLALQARATNRVDTSLANKLRHLKMARTVLELLARDHETVIVDVVAPAFLDRYHWTMEAMTEAIPALERHIGSLEEYLGYLKGRAERLTGLVRSITALAKYNYDATAFAFAVAASSISASASASASVSSRSCANHHRHHHNNASASSLSLSSSDDSAHTKNCCPFQSSDASLSLRCNDGADSRPDLLGSLLLDPPNGHQYHRRRQPRPRPQPVAAQSFSSSRRSNSSSSRNVLVPSGLGPGNALGIIHPRPHKPSSHHQHQSSPPPAPPPPDDVEKTPTATATNLSPSTTPPPLPTTGSGPIPQQPPPTTSSHNLRAAFYNPTQTSRRLRRLSSTTTTSSATTTSLSTTHSHNSTLTRTTEQSRSSNRGFYASYLLRGNYSHRLA